MIKKIVSKRVELPVIFLIENEEDFKELPRGLPYIIGTEAELGFITLFLEFQVLYKSCLSTRLPIKWLSILSKLGFKSSLKKFELHSGGNFWKSSTGDTVISIDDVVTEQYLVNFDTLSNLKILPKWLDDLKTSVEMNIIDEVTFNPLAFNKQLGLNIGASAMMHNNKNLLVLDVSGSIPRAVVKTTVALAKLMSKKFYADILITSGQSVLIDYDEVQDADIENIARVSGSGNEGEMFSKIIGKTLEYNTVIAFGDNDNPEYYLKQKEIKCNITVETLYSLHTDKKSTETVGYARCFKPKHLNLVHDWVETLEG